MPSPFFSRAVLASVAVFLALSPILAAPTRRSSFSTPGAACSNQDGVICSGSSYQQCGNSVWTAVMPLADGTDCSVWGSLLIDGTTSSISASSTTEAPTESAKAAVYAENAEISSSTADQTSSSDASTQPTSSPASSLSSFSTSDTSNYLGSSGASTALAYQYYSGPSSSFPAESSWLTFDALWTLNGPVCARVNGASNAQLIHDDILRAAAQFAVDARVILAVVLQESTCILGVASTGGASTNSGLMQSHNGKGYDGTAESVWQMIADGTDGTWYLGAGLGGDGLSQLIAKYGVYGGLRAYNSGENGVNVNNLSVSIAGMATYVSDIANRLVGAKVAN